MKCPNCGGEVDFQSVVCPYCNSEYEPGKLFQQEVAEKIANNKLFVERMVRNKTPEMISAFLTKSIISVSLAAVVTLLVAFGVYVIGERDLDREPEVGTYAWKYAQKETERIENEMIREYMYDIVVAIDTGEEVRETWVDYVLSNAYYPMRNDPDSKECQILRAFMVGYLQMSEEEIAKLTKDYDTYTAEAAAREQLTVDILERLGGGE